ncbi:mitochondrial carrier domain-containing protein [Pilobolus umbonatus]|nr:mitochondrial carrier domain-containing protein [Pilobolus umbonatus]
MTATGSSTTSYEKLLSACGGALATSLMVTPLDVIKMRLQTQQITQTIQCCMQLFSADRGHCSHPMKLPNYGTMSTLRDCHSSQSPLVLKGTIDGLYKIVKYEGLTALWRGLSPALIMSVPANVIYFVGYDYLRDMIQPHASVHNKDVSPLLAGAIARTAAVTIISPIELFRTRLQAATGVNDFKNVWQGVREMVMQDGIRSLYRGLSPTLCRDVPFSAIYWMGYEEIKHSLEMNRAFNLSDLQISFVSGALSGMMAAAITTPFDVVKTRRQVDSNQSMRNDTRLPLFRQIYQQHGLKGLFSGIIPRIAKIGPSCAIMISSYEMGKIFFTQQHHSVYT